MKKLKCALIGPANIGTDLLAKLLRSPVLEPVWMVGIGPDSDGLKKAREMGLETTAEGVDGLIPHLKDDGVQIKCLVDSAVPGEQSSRIVQQATIIAKREAALFDGDLRKAVEPLVVAFDACVGDPHVLLSGNPVLSPAHQQAKPRIRGDGQRPLLPCAEAAGLICEAWWPPLLRSVAPRHETACGARAS
jgi:hypothetical protein